LFGDFPASPVTNFSDLQLQIPAKQIADPRDFICKMTLDKVHQISPINRLNQILHE
jgi:hypothetical protein